ncbi:hypothetical protein SLEP1_g34128 [Rubroshorea leprosula]|nr:hypothetical protein SLEP1_g34128 [Rubroshorea leprosula]
MHDFCTYSSSCMASDGTSPVVSPLTLFFFLLIMMFHLHSATLLPREHFPHITSRKLGSASTMVAGTDIKTNALSVPPPGRRRSSLPWQERVYNTSSHEVPSGPNPISNR